MKKLIADEGYVFTNGKTFGKEVCLLDSDDVSEWRQIDESEAWKEPMKYSVVSIIEAMRGLGKYEEFRAMLESARLDWDFVGANYMADNHPAFVRMRSALVDSGIVTKDQLDELLPKCIWSAD